LFPFFATGVVFTGSKFTAGVVDTGGKFVAGINDTSGTGGKFVAGINDTSGTGGKFTAGDIDVVHHLRKFVEKILNEPIVIFRGLGEDDSGKKPEQKIL
jgi:hypothetical protein